MEQQLCWEYCRLYVRDSYHDFHENIYSFDVQIWFVGSQGDVVEQQIATMAQAFPFDLWLKVVGLLGGCGWELVTIKIGAISEHHDSLLLNNQVAYFKRPIISGRPIDDVVLNFTMNGSIIPRNSDEEN
jgi:hypothetical protein